MGCQVSILTKEACTVVSLDKAKQSAQMYFVPMVNWTSR